MQLSRVRLLAGAAAITGALALSACIPPTPEPTPAPSPAPTPITQPTPVAPPVAAPAYDNWLDAPQTPGDWLYEQEVLYEQEELSTAAYFTDRPNQILFGLTCRQRAGGEPNIFLRVNVPDGNEPIPMPYQMRIRTETQERLFESMTIGYAGRDGNTLIDPNDPFLDAMAFSKGRIAVEVVGARTYYIPAWPEVTRVIEDCRR